MRLDEIARKIIFISIGYDIFDQQEFLKTLMLSDFNL